MKMILYKAILSWAIFKQKGKVRLHPSDGFDSLFFSNLT